MGSKKSLRYEVLVRPKTSALKEQQSTFPFLADDDSSPVPTALFETKVQRFACDRENMQQYWIPEGYRPVLIPRAFLADSLVAAPNNNNSGLSMNPVNSGNVIHQLRSRISNNDNINDIEARRRRNLNFNNSTSNNGGIMKKRRRNNNFNVNSNRRTILGQSPPAVNMNTIVNKQQRIKEKISAMRNMRNSAVTISQSSILKNNNLSDRSPSIIIGEMWKVESEKVKKHYERLAIRKKIAQALAFEQKFSSPSFSGKSAMNHVNVRSTPPSLRHRHVNPATCPLTESSYRSAVRSNAVEGVDSVNFDVNSNHQNVDSAPSSSPSIFNDSNRPIPDWMTRSDAEDFYDENDENSSEVDLDADAVTTIA